MSIFQQILKDAEASRGGGYVEQATDKPGVYKRVRTDLMTWRHYSAHPELAVNVSVEDRCKRGWFDRAGLKVDYSELGVFRHRAPNWIKAYPIEDNKAREAV